MLPHIIHSTTRAVAVVQNQTHTIRNVLQLQSSGPSSGSSSSWGNGPGPGGSKYAGSRFYAGYNSAGRAVTQANAVTSNDGSLSQNDENDDFVIRRPALPLSTVPRSQRPRSASVSMGVKGGTGRSKKMSVLTTVLTSRGIHAFAQGESLSPAKEKLLTETVPSPPLIVRRNSTSAPLSPLLTPSDEPVRQQQPQSNTSVAEDSFVTKLQTLARSNNELAVVDVIRRMLITHEKPTVQQINAGLHALSQTRPSGEPLTKIIELHNTMLERSVVANTQTYECLIDALLTRDLEVQKVINSLETRMKRAPLVGRLEAATIEADEARVEQLKQEDNFSSAMSLFEGVLATGAKDQLSYKTYNKLLLACAYYNDVNSAIHVFAQLESHKDGKIGFVAYRAMISVFSKVQRIEDAEQVFEAFLASAKNGRLHRFPVTQAEAERKAHIMIWNAMIEAYFRAGQPDKAIGMIERMLQSSAGDHFTPADVPVPTSSTFATVIAGFITTGDLPSALNWFNNLLAQERTPSNPFEGLGGKAMRPDSSAWHLMLDALAESGNLGELNRLYTIYKDVAEQDNLQIRPADHVIVHHGNMANLDNLDDSTALQTLQFLLNDIADRELSQQTWAMKIDICNNFVSRGNIEIPTHAMVSSVLQDIQTLGNIMPAHHLVWLQRVAVQFIEHVYASVAEGIAQLPFVSALDLSRMGATVGLKHELRFAPYFLHAYGQTKALNLISFADLTVQDWSIILSYAAQFEANSFKGNPEGLVAVPNFAYNGLASLLEDMARHGVAFDAFDSETQKTVLEVLGSSYGEQERDQYLARLGPSYLEAAKQFDQLKYAALEDALSHSSDSGSVASGFQSDMSQSPVESVKPVLRIDKYLSRAIDDVLRSNSKTEPEQKALDAFAIFEDGLKKGLSPQLLTVARLIELLGRKKELDKVRELYTTAQSVLPLLNSHQQMLAWVKIEDSMIIALAHAGHMDAAHVHRLRVLEHGGCPSADSYGVLIQNVKDTTDDASAALSLFQEAIERGVKPNLYLYNNIISKLSKARKADYALELFQQMKASGVKPSSITYGAVIGACARVGDVLAADSLFNEMVAAPDFRPRVPPYNTMMQLYTTTKPNRSSVLHFRHEMHKAGVKPSAHTYKLLLDAFGSIEPVDLPGMERVFADLQKDTSVPITGAQFASLINAYGCVAKDLDKALSVFESMHTVPRAPAADAVVFEAIINVIVAHKRTDLIPLYINKMNEAGVHMTAYIANFLIKGYANVNDMEQARAVFESLSDPPTGVAAPNNHAPHSPSSSPEVPLMEPVYREPSTWEVMVRAELGAGNRGAAIELLERLRERQYPEAVYNRIGGVLTDHTMPL
ncbi:hypothetical protein CPC08DRAFT_393028 [Agrocybe pediades]|nr:hypothetical protein CPC08DRAFT_393028 [Agrocybe pediades]